MVRLPLLLPRGSRLAGALTGLFWFLASAGYLGSVHYIPVSLAALIFFTFPILTALGAAALQYSFWRGWPGATALPYALNAVGGILTIIWYPCMRSVMSEQQPPCPSAPHGAFAGSG